MHTTSGAFAPEPWLAATTLITAVLSVVLGGGAGVLWTGVAS